MMRNTFLTGRLVFIPAVFLLSGWGKTPAASAENKTPKPLMSRAVLSFLPAPLSLIKIKKTSKEKAMQILGPPLKTDKDQNLFYTLENDLDTTIGFKEGKIHYILHSPAGGALLLDEIKSKSPDLKFLPVQPSPPSHSSAHSFNLTAVDQSLKITVSNNSQKSIETIVILK